MPFYRYPPWDPRNAIDAVTRELEKLHPHFQNGIPEVGSPERKQRKVEELRKEGLGHCIGNKEAVINGDCFLAQVGIKKLPDHCIVEVPSIDEACITATRNERNVTGPLVSGVFKEYLSVDSTDDSQE